MFVIDFFFNLGLLKNLNKMVKPVIFISIALIFASCQSAEEKEKWAKLSNNDSLTQTVGMNEQKSGEKFWEELVWMNAYDKKGRVQFSQPVPASWKFPKTAAEGEPIILGDHNLKIYVIPAKSYTFFEDNFMRSSSEASGIPMRRFPGIENLLKDEIGSIPGMNGYSFVKYYDLPEVSKVDQWYQDQLYKVAPRNDRAFSVGSEWKDENGKPIFVLLKVSVLNMPGSEMWTYFGMKVNSDPEYLERSKNQLVFMLANIQYNLEPIKEYNEEEARKAGISWAAHNARMAANQAAFQAQQRAFVNKSDAVNKAIMDGYNSSMASQEKSHKEFIDVINEKTNVVDNSTGKTYKVESHYNKYWMNSNGEYISTDKHTYDPNLDEGLNKQKWEELHKQK